MLFKREVRSGLKAALIWTLSVAVFNIMMIAFIKSFTDASQPLLDMIKAFPPQMIKAFGLDRLNLADPLGYYATEIYLIVVLTGSIFAALTGAALLSKEEDEKTVEFLLAKPISRRSVIGQKALACLVFLLIFIAGVTAVNMLGYAALVDQEYSRTTLLHLSIAPFFVQLAVAGMSFLAALFWTRRRAVYSVAMGLTMGTYFIGIASLVSDRLAWLRWFSPFRYVEAADIAVDGGIKLPYVLVLVAIASTCVLTANALYARRDITT